MRLERNKMVVYAGVAVGTVAIVVGLLFFPNDPNQMNLIFFGFLTAVLPVSIVKYLEYRRVQEMERYFPEFLRDLGESIRSGMTLPSALTTVSKTYYGALSEEVRKIASQVSWGIPFDEALLKFSRRIKSRIISRSVAILVEAFKFGGDVASILETVAEDARTLKEIEEERRGKMRPYLVTLYFVYIVFLGTFVILEVFFLPYLPVISSMSEIIGGGGAGLTESEFRTVVFHLVLIEGFISGIAAGIMGEGRVIAGIKHSLILLGVGFIVFQIFAQTATPEQRIADLMVQIPPGSNIRLMVGTFLVDRDISVTDIWNMGLEKDKQGYLKSVGREGIEFVEGEDCMACGEDFNVLPDRIIVFKPSRITFRLHVTEHNYLIEVS